MLQLYSFHKTGVYLTNDLARTTCTLFGFNSTDCWDTNSFFQSHQECLKVLPASSCPLRKNDRMIVFFREPKQQLLSGYAYHRNAQDPEPWTLTTARTESQNNLARFWKMTQTSSHLVPMTRAESFRQYLQRLSPADGLRAEQTFDAMYTIPDMQVQFAACRPPACLKVCLHWFQKESKTMWTALAQLLHPSHRKAFIDYMVKSYRPDTRHRSNSRAWQREKVDLNFPWKPLCRLSFVQACRHPKWSKQVGLCTILQR